MNLRLAYVPGPKNANTCDAFHLTPPSGSPLLPKQREYTNLTTRCDRLDMVKLAYDFELHA